jgi:hypothetical protein
MNCATSRPVDFCLAEGLDYFVFFHYISILLSYPEKSGAKGTPAQQWRRHQRNDVDGAIATMATTTPAQRR